MKTVIFLGPSLPVAEARRVLPDAVYLPPARQSDIVSALTVHRPDVIGLVDGEFGQSLSVWHKEILYALQQGVPVFGSSSMGALRAAETATFGTVGIGRVFALYASGEINDDDEVALAHGLDEDGYRAFSLPFVNVRLTLAAAVAAGAADAALADAVLAAGKRLYFPERTWTRIFREAAGEGADAGRLAELRAWAEANYVDAKRDDALELLATIRDLPVPVAPPAVDWEFSRTHLFEALYQRDRRVPHAGTEVPLAAIANHAALHHPEYNAVNSNALNRALVGVLAEMLEVEATDAQVDEEIARFGVARGLNDETSRAAWARDVDLEPHEFREMMRDAARARILQRWLAVRRSRERTTRLVLDELRLRGEYTEHARAAAAQEQILAEQHQLFESTSFEDLPTRTLVLDHLRATRCRMDAHYRVWAEDAGFHSPGDMRVELLRARLAREHRARVGAELMGVLGAPAVNGG
jgi:hypothetical protein